MLYIHPWDLVTDPDTKQLVFIYEQILTEMRSWARAKENRQIREWVERLDVERDEFVKAKSQ